MKKIINQRYYYDGLYEDIYDGIIEDYPSNEQICITLNELEQENAVLKKALELACDFAGLDADKWSKEFIEQAKESMK